MISLRNATDADLPLMMAWRSNPEIYQGMYEQKEPLKWDEHVNWWKSRPSTWKTFIVQTDDEWCRPVGLINIGQMEHWSPEIGYLIGCVTDWRKGYMKEALIQAMKWLKEQGYEYCHTTIKIENERSANLAYRLGFEILGGAREGEIWLSRNLMNNYLI